MTRWVVVGAGSAGCVVAARLSEVASNDVTLLEAGPDHGDPTSGPGPLPSVPDVTGAGSTSPYAGAEVIRRSGDAPVPYLQGHGVGGSSLVNGSLVVGPPGEWAEGVELPVVPATPIGPVGAAVLAATSDAAPVGMVARDGRRVTAADAYLRPALGRANLRVRTGAAVDSVRFEGRRAVGVVVGGDDVPADRVVLCAGAIESPAILLRSGVDTPGVGGGLQDHAGVAFAFDRVAVDDAAVPIGVTVERPGRQIVVIERLPDEPGMGALLAGHLAVTSRGAVTVGEDGAAVARLAQLTTEHDRTGLATAAREALDLVAALAAAGVVGAVSVDDHGTGVEALRDDDALRRWLPGHLGGYHHVAGSCHAALAADGSLLGHDGIAVCDASALAGPPIRNPYLTLIRHAEVTARRWTARPTDRPG